MEPKFYFNRTTLVLIVISFTIISKKILAVRFTSRTRHQKLLTAEAKPTADERLIQETCKRQPEFGNTEDFKQVELPEETFEQAVAELLKDVTEEEFNKPFKLTIPKGAEVVRPEHNTGIMVDKEKNVALVKTKDSVELIDLTTDGSKGETVHFSCGHVVGSESVEQCKDCIAHQMEEEGKEFDFNLVSAKKEEYPQIFQNQVEAEG